MSPLLPVSPVVALYARSAPAEGRVAGKRFTIAGVECYLVEPRDRSTFRDQALILIPDATGISNPELRLLAGASLRDPLSDVQDSVCAPRPTFASGHFVIVGWQRPVNGGTAPLDALPEGLHRSAADQRCRGAARSAKADCFPGIDGADRYATEGNFLVVLPDIIDKGDVRLCRPLLLVSGLAAEGIVPCALISCRQHAAAQAADLC